MTASARIDARVLIEGQASGKALVLTESLSFWGGFDPIEGRIIDIHHPQYSQLVADQILFIPQSHGSAGTPGGIAECLRNGSGPLAFVLAQPDVNIGVGVLVANRLYDLKVPVLEIELEQMLKLCSGASISISAGGLIRVN